MSTASEWVGTTISLNRGGTAQVGQITYEQPTKTPKFINILDSSIGTYLTRYTDGQDNFALPAGCGAWQNGVPLPNVIDLSRYITDTQIYGDQYIDDYLERGEKSYNEQYGAGEWDNWTARLQQNIVWLWGSLREGGCGITRFNATQIAFIGTYGIYNNENGDDERIASTIAGPYNIADVTTGCLAVYYWYGRDEWEYSIDMITPVGSQVVSYVNPYDNGYGSIIWTIKYCDIGDTLDNSMIPIGDGRVPYTVFSLNSVFSPYQTEHRIFFPAHVIDLTGYSLQYGSPDNGTEDNEYLRGADAGNNNGNGDYNTSSDPVDGTEQTQFSVDAQSCGFVTVYKPDKSTLQDFAQWLYGTLPTTYGSFLDSIKKLQLNPMDGIISLNISHYNATATGAEPIGFYGQNSDYSAPIVSSLTYVEKCGTIHINEFASGWMSYNDLTKIKVHLPYCGTYSLSTNEVMGADLELKYIIDVLTGACVAEIKVIRPTRSIGGDAGDLSAPIYTFTGNVFQQIPISAVDYSGIIQGQMGLLSGSASFISGIGTGNVGSVAVGISSMVSSSTAHPSVETVGGCGASYGYMTYQEPFITQEYPLYNMPSRYENYYAEPLYNYVSMLSYCNGTTKIDADTLWTDKFDFITAEEENILKDLCNTGVIFIDHTSEYYNYNPDV